MSDLVQKRVVFSESQTIGKASWKEVRRAESQRDIDGERLRGFIKLGRMKIANTRRYMVCFQTAFLRQ